MPPTGELKAGKPKQTRARRTVKLISKVKGKTTLPSKTNNTKVLIMLLAKLFDNNWKDDQVLAFFTFINEENVSDISLDLLYFLATSLHKANSTDSSNFVFATQVDFKERKTYKLAINNYHA